MRLSENELRLLDRALTVYLDGVSGAKLSNDDVATEVLRARIQHTLWSSRQTRRAER